MAEALPCLGAIVVLVVVIALLIASNKKEAEQYKHFTHQQKILEAWAPERFGPSEVSEAAKLRPPNPNEGGLDTAARNRRRDIVRRLPKKWAEEIIR